METKCKTHLILGVILLLISPAFFPVADLWANEDSKYLDAVREFADNVLKYGRDTYGPKHTPLFVDGLNVHTHEPVKWIAPNGDRWILSNLASQQNLFRTLDSLTAITGDPKYRQAAKEAIKYAFENLRSPNGLFYWGHSVAYDPQEDVVQFPSAKNHVLKLHYPYYELMWQVDPEVTKCVIEAIWSAHVSNWSNLDFNRFAHYSDNLEQPWNHVYKSTPVFFKGNGKGFFITGSSLIQAATTLYKLSGQEEPLLWSKRLAKRFVDVRHPNTGISSCLYNNLPPRPILGNDMKDHFQDPCTRVFPFEPFEEIRNMYYTDEVEVHDWASFFLVGDSLGDRGREFTQWALEEFTACGKASYRKKDNSFIPILTDGTSIEGYIAKEHNSYGPKGAVAKSLSANLGFFWAYTIGYRTTGDEFMWEMSRNIGLGNSFGDIGRSPRIRSELKINTTCSDVYGLLGFLELYEETGTQSFLEMARQIANNILATKYHRGFFVPSGAHIYARFDCFEPLALLRLLVAEESQSGLVPQVWPSCPLFVLPYRYKQEGVDRLVIYDLTETPEPPFSLQEAAASGDVSLVQSFLDDGVDVNSWEDTQKRTALQCAALRGHRAVVQLLISKGAMIDAKEDWPGGTALHYAAENGHRDVAEFLIDSGADINAARTYPAGDTPLRSAILKGHRDIVELLISKGADINAKNDQGRTPLDFAIDKGHKDIVKLLMDNGAKYSSIHIAAQTGDQAQVKVFLSQGIDINVEDDKGNTPLFYAIRDSHDELAQFLIDQGADINYTDKNGYGPLHHAIWYGRAAMVKVLVSRGADVNLMPEKGYSSLHYAVWNEDVNTVKLLVDHGAQFNEKDPGGWTAFYNAVWGGNREIVDFLVSKGADISTFYMTAAMGDVAGVNTFLEQGLAVDTKDEMECTPLSWATCMGQVEVVKLLIAQGANVNLKLYGQATALHQAARVGNSDIAQLLITQGADVNAKEKDGRGPLHRAVQAGHREVVRLLLAQGADVNAKDSRDRTPLDLAKQRGFTEVIKLMRKNGAKE